MSNYACTFLASVTVLAAVWLSDVDAMFSLEWTILCYLLGATALESMYWWDRRYGR